jgi:polyhydroxyalkanoate synthesis regulator phasin
MKDFLHKAWLFGVGMFDFTKEKVESLVQEMVQRGEITQQESPEAVKQIMSKAQEAQQALMDKVKAMMGDMRFARAADLEALEKRVAALEEAIKGRQE